MRKGMTFVEFLVISVIVLILCSIMLVGGCTQLHKSDALNATVTSKERGGNIKNGKWIVFCKDETFEVSDTFVGWRWDSSDLYGKIEVGKTYNFHCRGYRVPFFSWYRNIMSFELVTPEKKGK